MNSKFGQKKSFSHARNMCMKLKYDHWLNNKTEEKNTSKCDILESQEDYLNPQKNVFFFKMPAREQIGFENEMGSHIFFVKKRMIFVLLSMIL